VVDGADPVPVAGAATVVVTGMDPFAAVEVARVVVAGPASTVVAGVDPVAVAGAPVHGG
jgi:hypothetical protein